MCFDTNYGKIARLKRDRFAISTYPFGVDAISTVNTIPTDWFTRGADRAAEKIVIAETGWNSESLVAMLGTQCLLAIPSSETEELAYLQRVVADADAHRIELVTWWSNRDVIEAKVMTDCPCTFDEQWCNIVTAFRSTGSDDASRFLGEAMLKMFGTMGVRGYEGTPKPLVFPFWQSVLARPLNIAGSG